MRPGGRDSASPSAPLLAWVDQMVQKGMAPSKLIVTKSKGDDPRLGVARTRPVCPYPQVATYKGSASVDEAANFVCALPKTTMAAR